jgi:low temperature requirement protein LtrA
VTNGAEPGAGAAEAGAAEAGAGQPLRVSTLELFFDLVFVFTITQLTGMLSRDLTARGALRVLLIFAVLWWMYGGYAWLTNARTPQQLPERLLLLLGMAGFLIIGLAVPRAFSQRGEAVALGLGYLLVVAVHGALYLRLNRNIRRVFPFNLASALLVIAAGIFGVSRGSLIAAGYALWILALAVQALSPLVVRPEGRFSIQPAHFVERHGALIIVAFGESVADIGIGAAGRPVTVGLVITSVLGLALAAALWWAYFGVGDDEQAEQAMTRADPADRPAVALQAYFYAYIPMLLGIVALAAGVKRVIGHAGGAFSYPACLALGGGVALYLAGDAAFRHALRIGTQRYRAAAAALALAASAVGVTLSVTAEIALLTVIVSAALAADTISGRRPAGERPAGEPGPRRGPQGGTGGRVSPVGGVRGDVPPVG